MATNSLSTNVTQAINDFGTIKTAIVAKGVDVPTGTPTSQYGTKIAAISTGTPPPTKGFVPTAWDANGYITQGKWYGTTMPTNTFRNTDASNGPFRYLNNITFEDAITTIGSTSFYYNTNLAITSLPNTITSIGASTFYGNISLALTSLPPDLTTITDSCFRSCANLALTSLPSGITTMSQYAFFYCQKIAITSLPTGLATLPTYAFHHCDAITNLDIYARTLTATYIFSDCIGLTTVSFKNTLLGSNSMSSTTFSGCTNLTTINCRWSSGAVNSAPWGAVSASIVYDVV